MTVGSWIGLAMSVRRSFAARHEIREALRELPDPDPATEDVPVRVERNVVFGRAGARNLRLDVHAPAEPPAPGAPRRPALVQVHGGGWVIGFKDRQGQLLMRRLAAQGWVCVNVDYRLSPMATFPDHLVDVKRAIAWLREHADDYGIDPTFVAVTGGSAGGHLAALTALTAGRPEYQPGFESADASVQAAVPFYGVYDFTNRLGTWPEETIPEFLAPIVMKSDPGRGPGHVGRRVTRWTRSLRTRHRSSSSTVSSTSSRRSWTRASSSSVCARSPNSRCTTWSCAARSTRSTRSRRCAPTPSWTPRRASSP